MGRARGKHADHPPFGPYSRALRRGAVGGLDGRTPEGRFLRDFEAQLVDHVGGNPTVPQRLLIQRAAIIALRLNLFDRKFADGSLTDLDVKVYGGLNNAFRLLLREIGLKKQAPPKSLKEYIESRYGASKGAQAA